MDIVSSLASASILTGFMSKGDTLNHTIMTWLDGIVQLACDHWFIAAVVFALSIFIALYLWADEWISVQHGVSDLLLTFLICAFFVALPCMETFDLYYPTVESGIIELLPCLILLSVYLTICANKNNNIFLILYAVYAKLSIFFIIVFVLSYFLIIGIAFLVFLLLLLLFAR